jgi:hypothetical protein
MLFAGAVIVLAAPAAALAASPFDGTWKTDPASVTMAGKPTVFVLANGEFACPSCTPPYKVKADGQPHPYANDSGYVDALAIEVVDAHLVKGTGLKGGKKVGSQTFTVSPDGKTLTERFVRAPKPGAPPMESSETFSRVAAGPAGSHGVSGTWRPAAVTSMSPAAAEASFKVVGPAVDWRSGDGALSYHAMVGGEPVKIMGDPAGSTVTVEKIGERKIVETDWRKGKKTEVDTFTVSPDGKSMKIEYHVLDSGRVSTEIAHKI